MNLSRRCPLSSFIGASAAYLRNAAGWRRAWFAFVFGSVLSLTMPPFGLFPLLWICLPALIFLLQGTANKRQAFAIGWCFAFGFLMFSLYWTAASMFVDIQRFWWAVPLAVAGLPACFAIYYGLAALAARMAGLSGIMGAVTFALLWFLADYARGHMFTGFPWNILGYTWSRALPVLQITSVTGIYGLTLLTTLAASLPAAMSEGSKTARNVCFAGIVFFIALAIGGEARLHLTPINDIAGVRLRVVQPDTDQAHKWLMNERERDFNQLLDLTASAADKPVTHIIWPETASTYYLAEDAQHRQQIAARIPPAASVITGVIRRDMTPDGKVHFYNSLVAVDGLGRLIAGYDKAHLVPFGEYMPLRGLIPVRAIAADMADFTPGDGARSLRVPGLPPFSPLICYEVIFPGAVVDRNDRPDFMINLTNDAWYGNTIGPYQHFAIARVRSIEEGLSLVRAANTGISGVIDPLGRIGARLGLDKRGFIDSDLPAPLPPTLFVKWREKPLWAVFLIIITTAFVVKRRKI